MVKLKGPFAMVLEFTNRRGKHKKTTQWYDRTELDWITQKSSK